MKRRPWTITGVISLIVFVLVAYCYWLNEQNAYLTWRLEHPTHTSSSRSLTERSEIVVLLGLKQAKAEHISWVIARKMLAQVDAGDRLVAWRFSDYRSALFVVCLGLGVAADRSFRTPTSW